MDYYYIKRFRYDNNHIYLDLYCYETNVNFELKFCHCYKIKQHYKDIIKMLSTNWFHKVPMEIHGLIHIFETRRKELNDEKS